MTALLLIACSRRKAAGVRRGRAWDVYDGRLFQVLKKALRERQGWERRLHVLILSARYGVLSPDTTIDTYDERLTTSLARERGGLWADGLHAAVGRRRYRAVHANLGREYLRALPELGGLFPNAAVTHARGGIGSRNAQTRRWVLEHLPDGA